MLIAPQCAHTMKGKVSVASCSVVNELSVVDHCLFFTPLLRVSLFEILGEISIFYTN